MIKIRGGEIILEVLKRNGIDTLFGYPGGAVIPFYDILYDRDDFNHYRSSHEQGAVHAADGYARVTKKIGVCVATSGPGATNTVTGIATAYMDSVPMLIISGQVPRNMLGRDSFQEIDTTGITISITKHNSIVKRVEDLESAVQDAINIATTGRPGPVLIDIPKDLFVAQCEYLGNLKIEKNSEESFLDKDTINNAVELIRKSKKPIIYAGGGIKNNGCAKELKDFANKYNIPVVNTLMGLGTINRDNPLSLGLVGMHGFKEANMAITNSDLIISLGARFSDRVIGNAEEFQKNKKIIQVDIDSTEESKNVKADIFVNGTVRDFLDNIIPYLEIKNMDFWLDEINSFKQNIKFDDSKFCPETIIPCLSRYFFENEIVVTDVGQHQMWTAQYFKFSSDNSFITSGGLGTMGFGMGAAFGCKVGLPDKDTLLITGDGSFRMNCNELAMLSSYDFPMTIVMIKNNTLGMVRQWQKMFQKERYSETTLSDNVDYLKLLSAYNIEAVKATSIKELSEILESRNKNKSLFIQCDISIDENVIPIVPPGKAIYNLVLK